MSIKLMVVDDSKFVYNEMEFFLEGTEFELVRYCKSGEEAIAQLEEAVDLLQSVVNELKALSEVE